MPSGRWARLVRVASVAILSASGAVALVPTAANAATQALVTETGCTANTLPRNDDGSTGAIALPSPLRFYDRTVTQAFVNNNGNVTFDAPMSNYSGTIASLPRPLIAPFFADIDTRNTGEPVTYGTISYAGHPALCVNWVNVGLFGLGTQFRNSFQAVIVDRSDLAPGDFDVVFNYDRIESDRSGSVQIGFSAADGDSSHVYVFPGSLTSGAFLDSNTATGLVHHARESSVLGRYNFHFRNGVLTDVPPPDTAITSTLPAERSDDSSPAFTYSTTASDLESDGFQCRVTLSGATPGAWTSCPDAGMAYDHLGDGEWTFEVRAVDVYGLADATPASATFTIDTTGPAMTVDEGPAPLSNDNRPAFAFSSADEDLVSTECRVRLADVGDTDPVLLRSSGSLVEESPWYACEGTDAPGPLGDGDWVFEVRGTDDLGNVSEPTSYDFVIDTVATGVTITDAPSFLTNDPDPVFGYAFDPADDVDSVECRVYADGDAGTTDFEACGSRSQQLSGLDDGRWTFEVRAIDNAGNVGDAAAYSFEVDTDAPVVHLTSTPAGRTNDTTPTFTYASDAADVAYFDCTLEEQGVPQTLQGRTTLAPSSCDAAGFTSAPLADGRYRFTVTAVDEAGNRSNRVMYDFLVDTVAPETTITSAPAKVVDNGTVTFAYSADKTGASFECRLTTNGQAGAWQSCAAGSTTYTGLADGTYGFEVRATDRAGNTDATPAVGGFSVNAGRPTITASLASEHPVSASGWYRGPVTITYACAGNGSDVVSCPAPRVVPRAQRGRTFKATVRTADGDSATVSTTLFIDKGNPRVAIKGFDPKKTYTSLPKHVRCVASDPRSGLDDCTVKVTKVTRKDGQKYVVVVAKATDKAGNVKVLKKQARFRA